MRQPGLWPVYDDHTYDSSQSPKTVSAAVSDAIILLKSNEPPGGYRGAFSGGKDSVAIKRLAELAKVRVDWHYHQTTIDPPELVRFIREHHRDVTWDKPASGNMFVRMESKGFPTRRGRWCCSEYKESIDRLDSRPLLLGVRSAESPRRAKLWTRCVMTNTGTGLVNVLPMRLWSDEILWAFIREYKIPYCSLYDEGFKRLGCIGCPMTTRTNRAAEWERWPGFRRRWLLAFARIWKRRSRTSLASGPNKGKEWFGSALFDSHEELFEWWDDGHGNITEWRKSKGLRIKLPG